MPPLLLAVFASWRRLASIARGSYLLQFHLLHGRHRQWRLVDKYGNRHRASLYWWVRRREAHFSLCIWDAGALYRHARLAVTARKNGETAVQIVAVYGHFPVAMLWLGAFKIS